MNLCLQFHLRVPVLWKVELEEYEFLSSELVMFSRKYVSMVLMFLIAVGVSLRQNDPSAA